MVKKSLLIVIAIAMIIGLGLYSFNKSNTKVVAKVGNITITESQLLSEVHIKKKAFENMDKPQNDEFYQKVALGLLIKNALIDNEVRNKGISVSKQEALEFLNQQLEYMQSLADTELAKIQYIDIIKSGGFSNPEDYVNSPKIIFVTQKILARSKLKELIRGSNQVWQEYADNLLNANEYEIFVPIDISGFSKIERNAAFDAK